MRGLSNQTLSRKFVRLGALPWLTAELFATGAGGGQPGFHPLADQVTFELCYARKKGCHHSTVRRFKLGSE